MLAMLKRFVHMLGFARYVDKESRRKNELKDAYTSINMSIQLKDTTVRIVHAGRREEFYQNPVSVSELMKKYPGMCVARPEVFKDPHDCILSPEEKLLPGQKYFIIPCTTAKKLKRKHSKPKEPAEEKEAMLSLKSVLDVSEDFSEESVCSAKDFYVSKESWSKCLVKKRRRGNKQFVPPIQRPKMWRALEWEPSLTSVQEVSP